MDLTSDPPGLDPAPRLLRQQRAVEASGTRLPVSKCTSSLEKLSHSGSTQTPPSSLSLHPTDVYFSSLSPNLFALVTTVTAIVVVVRPDLPRLRLRRFELRWVRAAAKPWPLPDHFFLFFFSAFGRPRHHGDKNKNSGGGFTSETQKSHWNISPWRRSRLKLTWRRLQRPAVYISDHSRAVSLI